MIKVENAICIREEDEGLMRGRGDYHPGRRSFAARRGWAFVSMAYMLATYFF